MAPSRRNSGLEATTTSAPGLVVRMIVRLHHRCLPGRSLDDHTVKPSARLSDRGSRGVDEGKVGMAVTGARRRSTAMNDIGCFDRGANVVNTSARRRRSPPPIRWAENRHLPVERVDLVLVQIHAGDAMSKSAKQAPVTRPT